MKLSAQRRAADLAAVRASEARTKCVTAVANLRQQLRRDWKWPLVTGFGGGVSAGLLPVAATLRIGNGVLRLATILSTVPLDAMTRFMSRARSTSGGSSAVD